MTAQLELGLGWQGLAALFAGLTEPAARDSGWLRLDAPLVSSSFSLGLVATDVWRSRDQLGLVLHQPLRVEYGRATLRRPVGRTPARQLLLATHPVSLSPSGRTLELGLGYAMPLLGGRLHAAVRLRHEPGHRETAASWHGFQLGLELPW